MTLFNEEALRQIVREAVREVLAEERAREATQPGATAEFLSVRRAADVAEVSRATVREWIATGRLHRFQAGRELRVRRDDLEALLASAPSPAPPPAPAPEPPRELTPEEEARRVIALDAHRRRGE